MGKLVRFKNFLDQSAPFTHLSTSVAVGGTAFPVANVDGFSANWAIQIGVTGGEKSQILLLGTANPSGTALNTTGTTRFDYPVDTPVYAIKYDKIIVKRSTSGTSGIATAIGTLSIQPDNSFTQYDDTDGLDSYAYRASFFNSVIGTASETSDSDWITSAGFPFYCLANIRERTKKSLFSVSPIKDDSVIDGWTNSWLEQLNNIAIDVNQDYSLGTVDIAFGTDGLGTITQSDFKEARRIWFTSDGSSFYKATKLAVTDFLPNESFDDSHPYYYNLGDNIIGKKPEGTPGTARVVYYKRNSILVNDTDELPMSMRSYTTSFVNFNLSMAYYLDEKPALGDRFMALANTSKEAFRSEITPRSKTGPQTITLVDPLSADEDGIIF